MPSLRPILARTGRPIWKYTRQFPNVASHCTVITHAPLAVDGKQYVAIAAQSALYVFSTVSEPRP